MPPPFCENPTCHHDCGCEECTPDQVHCPDYDDTVMQTCDSEGICVEDTPCAEGNHCIPETSTAGRCSELYECDELQSLYDQQMARASCSKDEQCQVLAGGCDVGLGACWHPTNQTASVDVVAELVARWTEKSCGTDTCGGDCGAMPSAKCIDQKCTIE